jgi:4-hydroxybenzoate polyprenyltransferase
MTPTAGVSLRWAQFATERYEPVTHAVMATAFALGNAGIAAAAGAARPTVSGTAAAAALVVIFFFRLRVFDEIKDYGIDLVSNSDRPLPRGLISLKEARRAVWILTALELSIVGLAGWPATIAWAAALLYSLAMYREFGVGAWMRPHLELYAMSHTFVAPVLGISVTCLVLGIPFWDIPREVWVFAPANWALFNVFEFSRKTFAPSEERPGVGSYSRRWGPRGAVFITLGWVGLALGSVAVVDARLVPGLGLPAGALLLLAAPYAARPRGPSARSFRVSMSAWATALYVMVGITNLG